MQPPALHRLLLRRVRGLVQRGLALLPAGASHSVSARDLACVTDLGVRSSMRDVTKAYVLCSTVPEHGSERVVRECAGVD